MKKRLNIFLLFYLTLTAYQTLAMTKHTVELKMENGDFIPSVLEVPSKTIIRIKITNIGHQPAEFESIQLRKEKVLAPGAASVVVLAPLNPGTYTFFDDFHLSHPKGKIIAK